VRYSFLNWFPHLLLPNKEEYRPANMGGNYYAREVGLLPAADVATGVSFSAVAEAFHIAGWAGIGFLLPFWIFALSLLELVSGDLRLTPWGMFVCVMLAHVAPESGVTGLITFLWYGNVILIGAALLSTFVTPVIGALFTGSRAARPGPSPTFRSATA